MAQFSVVHGNVLEEPADLLLLKYATEHFGVDEFVSERLVSAGLCQFSDTCPQPGEVAAIATNGIMAPGMVMFLGTRWLGDFAYDEMRMFAADAIRWLAHQRAAVTTMTTTIHGAGYGLDAGESLQHLVLGFTQALMKHPDCGIRRVKFVERNEVKFRQLQKALGALGAGAVDSNAGQHRLDDQNMPVRSEGTMLQDHPRQDATPSSFGEIDSVITLTGQNDVVSCPKEHVFVAMPFTEEFEDVYEFGIYAPVRECGYICEKVDQSSFTGDILKRIQQRIMTAKLVIADLSEARPNVYLEVGFAWGLNVPVVCLARRGEKLHFDVQSHRCIFYRSIRQLAEELKKLLRNLDAD